MSQPQDTPIWCTSFTPGSLSTPRCFAPTTLNSTAELHLSTSAGLATQYTSGVLDDLQKPQQSTKTRGDSNLGRSVMPGLLRNWAV